MVLRPFGAARQIGRYRELANILARHGFGLVLDQTGLAGLVSWPARLFRLPANGTVPLSLPERLRLVVEEWGPTAVKLGQMLSTRPDLLPPDLIAELSKLQDTVPPFPYEEAAAVIQAELGGQLEAFFASFDRQPLAAASLAQVHGARLPGGEEVVVKVQRPGIERRISADLEILFNLAGLLERRAEWARRYGLVELVEEFARTIQDELNFAIEARNAERFRAVYAAGDGVTIPRVYRQYSTRRVLTLERRRGIKVSELAGLTKAGVDRAALARSLVRVELEQILFHGFFHADPHPGNLLVSANGQLTFLDFGMVGHLDDDLKGELVSLVLALARRDVDGVARGLLEVGIIRDRVVMRELKQDISRIMRRYYDLPARDIPVAEAIHEGLALAYKHRVKLPADLALLARALMTLDGVARQLDPELSVAQVAEPLGRDLLRERLNIRQAGEALFQSIAEAATLVHRLPRQLNLLATMLEEGELKLRVESVDPPRHEPRWEAVANRLALAVVVAAGIVGSVVLLQTDRGPLIDGLPAIGLGSMVITSLGGLLLVLKTLRSG